ncbi:transposase [Chromobacterium haemolyticum]|nr:transposase [Chromobacterium haemolyticum]
MSRQRFPEEFKIEAVKQVTERGYPVAEVAYRLGASAHSLYRWLKRYDPKRAKPAESADQQAEIRRLKAELKRVSSATS